MRVELTCARAHTQPLFGMLPVPSISRPSPVRIDNTPFAEDLRDIAELDALIAQGEDYVRKLYTSRYVARALPNSSSAKPSDALNQAVFDALRPKIVLLLELEKFQNALARKFVQYAPVKRAAPKAVNDRLVMLVDVVASLDLVKDMKSAHQNDFAAYKRAVKNARNTIVNQQQVEQEINLLETFMADRAHPRYTMLTNLKRKLHAMTGVDHAQILVDLLAHACNELEQGRVLFPEDKWRLIRFIAHCVMLLDAGEDQVDTRDGFKPFAAFKNKRVVQLAAPWVRRHPLVPLFAEMHIELVHVLAQCPTYAADAAPEEWVDEAELKRYELAQHWTAARNEFDVFVPRLAAVLARARAEDPARMDAHFAEKARAERQGDTPVRDDVQQGLKRVESVQGDVLDTCLAALRLLAKWKELIVNQTILKYSRGASSAATAPAERRRGGSMAGGREGASVGTDYESVVRSNYSAPEVAVLLDFVGLLKSLCNLLSGSVDVVAPLIRLRIYHVVQEFAQLRLCRLAHGAHKRKRAQALATMLRLRTLASDFLDGRNRDSDDYKGKHAPPKVHALEDRGDAQLSGAPRRAVPAPQHLLVMRMFCELLHDPDKLDSLIGGFLSSMMTSQDVDRAGAEVLRGFYMASYFFPAVTSLAESLDRCANLGPLWLREFYLEMSKSVQFPIDLSLPFILVKHVIEQPVEMAVAPCNLLLALEIYNDASAICLRDLACAFLYDELEAEVALVVEQLVFLLADHAYTYAKSLASAIHIDAAYRAKLSEYKRTGESKATFLFKQKLEEDRYLLVPCERLGALLAQRAVGLLGRSIDLQSLVAAQIDDYVRADLELCLGRFESSGLSSANELASVLAVVRATHATLSAWLPAVDPFDDVFRQVDLRLSSFRGRIVSQVLAEAVGDVMVNHAFNSASERFVRAPMDGGRPNDIVRQPKPSNAAPNFVYGARHKQAFAELHALDREFVGQAHLAAVVRAVGLAQFAFALEGVVQAAEQRMEALLDCLDGVHVPAVALSASSSSAELFAVACTIQGAFLNDAATVQLALSLAREVGNALAWLWLADRVVVQQDALDFARTCTWTGLDTEDPLAPGPVRRVADTPLGRTGAAAAEGLVAAHLEGLRRTPVLANAARRLMTASRKRLGGETRLRHWSALLFALCLRPLEFGEGVVWCAALGLAAAHARTQFPTVDVGGAVADAHELNPGASATKELLGFVEAFTRLVRPVLDDVVDLLQQAE